jgi:hypothetical protein
VFVAAAADDGTRLATRVRIFGVFEVLFDNLFDFWTFYDVSETQGIRWTFWRFIFVFVTFGIQVNPDWFLSSLSEIN